MVDRDVIKFCPGARYSEAKGGWFPVVRIFKNNRPVGSKTGCRPMASPSIAETLAIKAANEVAQQLFVYFESTNCEIVVALPKRRETVMLPRPRPVTPETPEALLKRLAYLAGVAAVEGPMGFGIGPCTVRVQQ